MATEQKKEESFSAETFFNSLKTTLALVNFPSNELKREFVNSLRELESDLAVAGYEPSSNVETAIESLDSANESYMLGEDNSDDKEDEDEEEDEIADPDEEEDEEDDDEDFGDLDEDEEDEEISDSTSQTNS